MGLINSAIVRFSPAARFFAFLIAVIFLASSIVGIAMNYSSVPVGDTWDGILEFIAELNDGNWRAWFASYGEHRIIFPRILYWIDVRVLHGVMAYLLVLNLLLAGGILIVYARFLKAAFPNDEDRSFRFVFAALLCPFLFAWTQWENLFHGFYGAQWFMSELFALLAFYFLYTSINFRNNLMFLLSVLFGLASAGTMAQGFFVLPLMILLALLLKMAARKIFVLIGAFVFLAGFYLLTNPSSDSASHSFLAAFMRPLDLLTFVLLFLGSPFHHSFVEYHRIVFHIITSQHLQDLNSPFSLAVAMAAGGLLVAATVFWAFRFSFGNRRSALGLTLVAVIAYAVLIAAAAAVGRLPTRSPEYALSLRYTTTSLLAWAVFLIIFVFEYRARLGGLVVGALLLMPAVLLPYQRHALDKTDGWKFEQSVAALALELGVKDVKQIKYIYWAGSDDYIFNLRKRFTSQELSGMIDPILLKAPGRIGLIDPALPAQACSAALESVAAVAGDPRVRRIEGWIIGPPTARKVPRYLEVRDPFGKIIGYAISGRPRPEKKIWNTGETANIGFQGYVKGTLEQGKFTLVGHDPDCFHRIESTR